MMMMMTYEQFHFKQVELICLHISIAIVSMQMFSIAAIQHS